MLTYRRSDSLEIRGYSDADFAGDMFTLAEGTIS
jgi:hypothetical protein